MVDFWSIYQDFYRIVLVCTCECGKGSSGDGSEGGENEGFDRNDCDSGSVNGSVFGFGGVEVLKIGKEWR